MSRIAGLEDFREPFGDLDLSAFINTASYVVFTRDIGGVPYYYAKNGTTGQIQFSGLSASIVITSCIGVMPNGGLIFIKGGNFMFTEHVYLPSYVILKGSGVELTTLYLADGAEDHVITLGLGDSTQTYFQGIYDLKIYGNKANQVSAAIDGIHMEGMIRDFIMMNVWVDNCARDAIHIYPKANMWGHYYGKLFLENCGRDGFYVNCSDGAPAALWRVWIESTYSFDNDRYGIAFDKPPGGNGAYNIYLTNVQADTNGQHGFYCLRTPYYSSFVNCVAVNNGDSNPNNYDGMFAQAMSNTIILGGQYGNVGTANTRYGIGFFTNAIGVKIMGSPILTGATTPIGVSGISGLIIPSKSFQFTEAINGVVSTTSPTGVDVDAATEGALAWGQLPVEVQQVVRIKVWAVATGAPIGAGGQMHLAATFNAGASNAAYNTATKSWALADFDGEEADYVANDVVSWVIEAGDAGNEFKNLLAGDSFEFFALYNAGADPDGATDAVFRCIEIEYV